MLPTCSGSPHVTPNGDPQETPPPPTCSYLLGSFPGTCWAPRSKVTVGGLHSDNLPGGGAGRWGQSWNYLPRWELLSRVPQVSSGSCPWQPHPHAPQEPPIAASQIAPASHSAVSMCGLLLGCWGRGGLGPASRVAKPWKLLICRRAAESRLRLPTLNLEQPLTRHCPPRLRPQPLGGTAFEALSPPSFLRL